MDYYRSEAYPDLDGQIDENGPRRFRRTLVDALETIVLSLVLFLGINAVSARIRIESVSMQPTLLAGDFVIVNKVAYQLGSPSRGDVIIFHYPPDPKREPYIKRIIGLPGDTVQVIDGNVLVNGDSLTESYISAPPQYQGEWVVPQDSLFVLGDNRNSSSDSHQWGMVPLANVIGKAELVYWPPTEWKLLNQDTAFAAEP